MLKRLLLVMAAVTIALSGTSAAAAPREAAFYGATAPLYYPGVGVIFTEEVADNLNEMGVRWLRLGVIREADESINYAGYDVAVNMAAARGISVLGLIGFDSLPWAPDQWETDAFRALFVAKVGEIVSHLSPRISAWEIWNEEDFSATYVSPAAYALLLRESYEAIKAIDPGATVVMGGLSAATPASRDYLRAVYQSPAFADYHPMDVVAVHPYNWTAGPYTYMSDALRFFIKAVMNDYGDEGKRLWLTEIGWNVHPDAGNSVGPGGTLPDNEALQGQYVSELFDLAATLTDYYHPELGPMVERVFLYNYADWGTEWFGLVRPDGTKRPSFYSYKAAAGGPVTKVDCSLPTGWSLLSIPSVPDNPDPAYILRHAVGAGNALAGNLYGYGGSYEAYPAELTALSPGAGYWLRLDVPAPASYWGTAASSPYSIPLSGWTLVGPPRAEPVAWADVEVTDGAVTLSVPDAAAAGWIQGQAFYYNGAGYHTLDVSGGDDTHLRPWRGYWVLAEVPGLTLLVP